MLFSRYILDTAVNNCSNERNRERKGNRQRMSDRMSIRERIAGEGMKG